MRSCFRALERHRVRYLLISGQAAVLYGASTFSEDVDIWVAPTAANWSRLLEALADCDARVYKLTPPLILRYARRGHGFHFTIPPDTAGDPPGYFDVMAVVPRCRPFSRCARRARHLRTAWGTLPVVHPADLALIKRTRRLADYDTVSALAQIELGGDPSRRTWRWALANTFDAGARRQLWTSAPALWRQGLRRPTMTSAGVARELERARQADRDYWRDIVAELKSLEREGSLIPEGTLVRDRALRPGAPTLRLRSRPGSDHTPRRRSS
jgi:hypothetical protein